MLEMINGKIVKRRRQFVGNETVLGPDHAPPRARKYSHKALCALPPFVKDASDREDRCAGLAIALFSELAQMPRADADAFMQSLPAAYRELIEAYGQEKQLLARQRCA